MLARCLRNLPAPYSFPYSKIGDIHFYGDSGFIGFLFVSNNEGQGFIRQEGTQSWTGFAFQVLDGCSFQGRIVTTILSLPLERCCLSNESEMTEGSGLGGGLSPSLNPSWFLALS